jgi:hypothetical protein
VPAAGEQPLRGLRSSDRRTLAAFAEALVPGGGRVPGAGPDDVDAAGAVSAFASDWSSSRCCVRSNG